MFTPRRANSIFHLVAWHLKDDTVDKTSLNCELAEIIWTISTSFFCHTSFILAKVNPSKEIKQHFEKRKKLQVRLDVSSHPLGGKTN